MGSFLKIKLANLTKIGILFFVMITIKLTKKEHQIISQVLNNLSEQIDEEICNLIPEDCDDDVESERIAKEARDAFSKLY